MNPRISVIIPYYNGEAFIAETITSVLAEGYEPLEIVVISDGSSPESLTALDAYRDRITLLTQDNQGIAAARNAGFAASTGELIAFLDQDDLWPPGRLARMLPHFTRDDIDFVRGLTADFSVEEGVKQFAAPLFREPLVGAALYRRGVIFSLKGFNPSMRDGDDFDFNIRLRESGAREERLADTTLWYRRHTGGHSNTAGYVQHGQFASLRNKLARMKNHDV